VLIRATFQIRDVLASQIGLFIIGTEDALQNGHRLDELGIEDTGELFMLQELGKTAIEDSHSSSVSFLVSHPAL
jgi:hypothetical protein